MQLLLHTQELLLLAFQHAVHGDAGPAGYDLRNVLRGNGFRDDGILYRSLFGRQFIEPLLGSGELAVTDFRHLAVVAAALRDGSVALVVLYLGA